MIFSENANSYTLEVTNLSSPEELYRGLWLVMAGIDAIPPHIALIIDGKYCSVSTKKIDIVTPIENFLKTLNRRKLPSIFIKFKDSFIQNEELGWAGLGIKSTLIFSNYTTLARGDHSCLWPVRDVFAKIFSENYKSASFVFELLKMAQEDNLIDECKSLFVDISLLAGEGKVKLPKYTHEQIRKRINSILKVNE